MSHLKLLAERLADQAKAREKAREKLQSSRARLRHGKLILSSKLQSPRQLRLCHLHLLHLGSRAYSVRGLKYALEAHIWITNRDRLTNPLLRSLGQRSS